MSSTRGHPYKLFKHHCSNTTRSVFFAERVINAWNSLQSVYSRFFDLEIIQTINTNYESGSLRLLHRLYVALY